MEKTKELLLKLDQRSDGSCCEKGAGKSQEEEMAKMKEELRKLRGDWTRVEKDEKKKKKLRLRRWRSQSGSWSRSPSARRSKH